MTQNTRWRRTAVLALIFLFAVAGALWWVWRPKRTAERFLALVSAGAFKEADGMLVEPSSLEIDAPGNIVITSGDGKSTVVNKDELPFVGLDAFLFRSRYGLGDYLAGRYRFPVVTSGPVVQKEQKEPRTVSVIATGNRIIIVAIK